MFIRHTNKHFSIFFSSSNYYIWTPPLHYFYIIFAFIWITLYKDSSTLFRFMFHKPPVFDNWPASSLFIYKKKCYLFEWFDVAKDPKAATALSGGSKVDGLTLSLYVEYFRFPETCQILWLLHCGWFFFKQMWIYYMMFKSDCSPGAVNGLWLVLLVPCAYWTNYIKHYHILGFQYKLSTWLVTGLVLQSILIIHSITNAKPISNPIRKLIHLLPGVVTTIPIWLCLNQCK